MNKKILCVLLSAVLVLGLLAGCGSSSTAETKAPAAEAPASDNAAAEAPAQEVTIEFWTIDLKAAFEDFFNEMIANYESENPGVTIKWVDVPYDDVQSKLVTAIAGGNAPDVVNLNTPFTLTLAASGTLVDLNKEATEEQKSIYTPGLWESARIGDGVYAFPWYASPNIRIYNTELLEKGGITKLPATYKEATAMAQDFYDKTGAYLFQPEDLFDTMIGHDIPILTEDKTAAAFNVPEAAEILANYKEVTDTGALPNNKWGKWDEALMLFESGKLAMINSSGSSLGRIKDEAPDIYEKIAIDQPLTGDTGLSRNPLMNLTVIEASKNHEAAIAFANYVTNDANQLAFCKIVSIFPSTVEASKDSFFTSDMESLEGQASAMSAKASLTSRDYSLGAANQGLIADAVNNAYFAVITNGDEIQPSLDQAEADVNAILSEQ